MQKNKNTNKAKVAKEGKRTSPENGLKDIFAATWVKIFLVTRISGVLGFFGQMEIETCVLVIFHLVFIFIWKKNKVVPKREKLIVGLVKIIRWMKLI